MEEKSKKGFTLVEILAVIVLIALIVIIAVPSVKSISAKSKRKLFDTKVRLAEEESICGLSLISRVLK